MNVKSQSVFQIHVFGIAFNPIYWKMEEFWIQHKSNKIVLRKICVNYLAYQTITPKLLLNPMYNKFFSYTVYRLDENDTFLYHF